MIEEKKEGLIYILFHPLIIIKSAVKFSYFIMIFF